jgi:hypothetical protein
MITAYRNVTPCSMTERNQRFGRAYFLHLQGTRANAHTVFIRPDAGSCQTRRNRTPGHSNVRVQDPTMQLQALVFVHPDVLTYAI